MQKLRIASLRVSGLISLWLAFVNPSFPAYATDAPLPECAHWTVAFVFMEFMPRAEVGGEPGQRLYMFRQNPQVCANEKLIPCDSKRYVIAGDRVTIGHECGAWAHVEFQSGKTRSTGWVERARLNVIPPDQATLKYQKKWKSNANSISDPLEQAVATGKVENVKSLLKSEADINRALTFSVARRQSQLAIELLQLGAKPSKSPDSCQIVMDAVHGEKEVLAALLTSGAAVNCTSGTQKISPLKAFAMTNRAERPVWASMGHLWDPGVDDPDGMLKLFLQHDVDLNIKDAWGGSPLRATLEHNNVDIARLLLEAGADVNNYMDDSEQHGKTILMEAIFWYQLTWDASLIKTLLDHGADVNFRDELPYDVYCERTTSGKCTFRGQTALTRAATDGLEAVVKLLLEHGANPTLPRNDGATPAEIARAKGYTKIATLIQGYARN